MDSKDLPLLEVDENIQLQNILQKHPLVKEKKGAILLGLCDLSHLEGTFEAGESSLALSATLIAELSKPHIKTTHGKPALFSLLVYVRKTCETFTSEEYDFLDAVISRYRVKFENKSHRQELFGQAFAIQRQHIKKSFLPTEMTFKRNLQEEIIISYDLDQAMGNFKAGLVHGQAAGFFMASDFYLLSQYILKRALHEFKGKIQGDYFTDELYLHQANLLSGITLSSLIKETIIRRYHYVHMNELIKKHPKQHIILTIWNRDLPSNMLKEAASSFWQEWVPIISPYLQKRCLCFALILAHLPPENDPCSIDGFTAIHLPTSTDMRKGVASWVAAKLHQLSVPYTIKQHYLAQLNDPHADCVQILRRLETIADSLQNTYNQDRYQERTPSMRKRTMK